MSDAGFRLNPKPLSLEDIARKAGVSRSTVSRVINNDPKVRDETRALVLKIVESEGYTPNLAARSLVTRRTRVIGVLIPHTLQVVFEDQSYFPTLLQGVAEILNQRDYSTLLWWGQSPNEEAVLYRRILQQNQLIDGLIIASARTDDPLPENLLRMHVPFVMVERPAMLQDEISYVTIDNVGSAMTAVDHLIDLGRRRIATITGALDNADGQDRLHGYRTALARAGLPVDSRLIVEGHFSARSGYLGMKSLLAQRPDAVFAASDVTAFGAMQALQEAGLRVPDDVALIGFDDLPAAAVSRPALTTMRSPIQERGAVAASLLINLLEGIDAGPRHILLPTQLVIRDSCGAVMR